MLTTAPRALTSLTSISSTISTPATRLSLLRSSQRFFSSTESASPAPAPATAVENNEPKIPKYYDKLRHEGFKEMSPEKAKELAAYGRQKSVEAKSKSRKLRSLPSLYPLPS
jgi:hypothetical protein